MTIDKQALSQLATDAHELGIIKRYTKGIEANKRFVAIATPLTVLGLLDELEAAENCIAEHRKVLNSLAAVARRYLPDYDEHPEIQAADELLESTAGIGVKGE
ncbi:ead/Ea22-like family protein [Citrobacter sp. wls757]|uniref:ead/Ea22-like family protein n=1 Tax=Citrobacter sp. wls757 TaxID=2576417 RepID=UPI0010C968B5|nr:ead/Ea22-like family protein [Citrobacter sp. wls757]TKU39781.1 ead/Ea22-like family protein [Citrobacter sp. wls757]